MLKEVSTGKESDYFIKLLLIGDSGVGKTCLLMRFSDNTFTESFISTIGIDFKVKTVMINGLRVKLQLWDTAGQERFKSITSAYYRNIDGILFVYDVSSRNTLDDIIQWMRDAKKGAQCDYEQLLVGNKYDKKDKEVSTEEGINFARREQIPFIETSAKTGYNVDKAFDIIVNAVLIKQMEAKSKYKQSEVSPRKISSHKIDSSSDYTDDEIEQYSCC